MDLSETPLPLGTLQLATLLHPPTTHLPSLRRLGLVRISHETSSVHDISDHKQRSIREERKRMSEVIRGEGRQRFVEVIWDDS